jgi:nickel-dependent lactate racemase
MTQIELPVGRSRWDLRARPEDIIATRRHTSPTPVADVRSAVRDALEHPLRFEALRRALTPDDRIALVVDESLPQLPVLLMPILEHLTGAGITPERITLLTSGSAPHGDWIGELPEAFEEVRTEVHDPADRRRMSYLASTHEGRRLYLNRTLVDADQVVILSGRGYDPLLGYSGAAGSIFPAFGDVESRQAHAADLSMTAPGGGVRPALQEAEEVAWLMGAPFLIQVIEGLGDEIAYICGGLVETAADGRRALDERWHVTAGRRAGTVVASMSGNPARQGFAALARALACAARVVEPGGCIVVLSESEPQAGAGGEFLRNAEEPEEALRAIGNDKAGDLAAAYQWSSAAARARVYVACDLPPEAVEEWFATPVASPHEVQRLLDAPGTCLFLPDGHKTLATVAGK